MRARFLLFILSSLAFVIGCSTADHTFESRLVGVEWRLDSLVNSGGGTFVPDTGTTYTIRFQKDGEVNGEDVCNWCRGEYSTDADKLRIAMGCSEARCTPGPSEFPSLVGLYSGFGDALNLASHYEANEDDLHVYLRDSEGNSHTLHFRAR